MSPELTGFLLGLLLGATKVMAIAAVGFGIAWWRGRARIRALESELLALGQGAGPTDERWRVIEERMNRIENRLERIADPRAIRGGSD